MAALAGLIKVDAGGTAVKIDRLLVTLCAVAPLAVPLITIGYTPAATVVVLPTSIELDPGKVGTGFGVNPTVLGAGLPDAASVTGLLKAAVDPTFTVNVTGVPAQTEAADGVVLSVKPAVKLQFANLKLPMRVLQELPVVE